MRFGCALYVCFAVGKRLAIFIYLIKRWYIIMDCKTLWLFHRSFNLFRMVKWSVTVRLFDGKCNKNKYFYGWWFKTQRFLGGPFHEYNRMVFQWKAEQIYLKKFSYSIGTESKDFPISITPNHYQIIELTPIRNIVDKLFVLNIFKSIN